MPYYYLDLNDVQRFECTECGIINEFIEVEYLEAHKWQVVWRLGCAYYGPLIGSTEDALEWLIEKPVRHYKTVDTGPFDNRKIELQSIVDDLKSYLGEDDEDT
ncbi:hypothetical protein PBI_GRAYSON_246 [Rhodococcus phage Grayson]|nr:hypothetical protein PBI_GRAYSON_246 [Rhodococcus phage Grayson]